MRAVEACLPLGVGLNVSEVEERCNLEQQVEAVDKHVDTEHGLEVSVPNHEDCHRQGQANREVSVGIASCFRCTRGGADRQGKKSRIVLTVHWCKGDGKP
jgi:hypothetical protein